MEILLMNTPTDHKELHSEKFVKKSKVWDFFMGENGIISGKNPVTGRQPPFGIMFLSSALKEKGHKVHVKEGFFTREKDIMEFLGTTPVKVVGVSCVSYNWERAKAILKNIKEKYPDVVTIVGGAHPNAVREEALEGNDYIDIAVYGDGEHTLLEILDRLKENKDLEGVEGCVIRKKGKIIKNPPRKNIKELDKLPFLDRDCIDIMKYQPSAMFYKRLPWTAIFGSRGCPYRCTFCHSNKEVRFRSAKDIVDEIEHVIKKYGIKDMTFYDETFTLNRKWTMDICQGIIDRKLDIVWSANARVNCIDEELLTLMKKAGCWRLLWGIESGVQKNLDKMKKDINLKQIRKAVKLTRKFGIESYGMFIFGVEGETYEEAMKTIKFACDIGLDYAAFSTIDPLPGTEFYNEVKDTPNFKGFDQLTMGGISYVSPQMTEEKLRKISETAFKKFYLRPGYMLWRISRLRSWEDFKRHVRGFLLFIGG